MTAKQVVYVVEALRDGDRERHTYVVGVWTTLEAATAAAIEEAEHRGGKYQCQVNQCVLDGYVDSDWSKSLLYQTQ
jgi:hypothetical protein